MWGSWHYLDHIAESNLLANITNDGGGEGIAAQSFQNFLGSPALSNTFKVSLGLSDKNNGSANTDLNTWLVTSGVFNKSTASRFDFLCSEASLPGTNLASIEESGARQGVTEFFAQSRAYVDLNLKFYLSADYQVLRLFQEWINFINPVYAANGGMRNVQGNPIGYANQKDRQGFHRFRYPHSYKRDITVTKFERNIGAGARNKDEGLMVGDMGKMINRPGVVTPLTPPERPNPLSYQFVNAFPESVDSIQLSYGDAQVLQVTVNFKYDRYVIVQPDNNKGDSTWANSQSTTHNGQTVSSGSVHNSVDPWNNGVNTASTTANEDRLA